MSFKLKLSLFKVKAIPALFWTASSPLTFKPSITSFLMLIVGLVMFGLGEALLIAAGVGVSPWTVFAQGVSIHSGWTIGFSTAVISSLVLLLWVFLKQIPGLGTIFNIIIISTVLDVGLPYLPKFDILFLNILMAVTGRRLRSCCRNADRYTSFPAGNCSIRAFGTPNHSFQGI